MAKGTLSNMAEVSESMPDFELLPADKYTVEVSDEMADKISKNGDQMVNIKLVVMEGPYKGRFVYDYIVMCVNPESPAYKVRWRAKMFLKAIGQPHNGDNFAWDSDHWLWKKCIAEIIHEPIKQGPNAGKLKAVVRAYSALPEETDDDIKF